MPRIMIKGGVWRNTEVRIDLVNMNSCYDQNHITALVLHRKPSSS